MVYLWMMLSLAYMVMQPFLTRPLLFNTALSAYSIVPMISDDEEWASSFERYPLVAFSSSQGEVPHNAPFQEVSYYLLLIILIHNITVLVVITLFYSILCGYVAWFGRLAGAGIDKVQIQVRSLESLPTRSQFPL